MSYWKLSFAVAAVATASFLATLYGLNARDSTKLALAAQVNRLVACGEPRANCTATAASVAKAIIDGDTVLFEAHAKSKFGVYLHKNRLVYVKANCRDGDLTPDLFALNYFPADADVLTPDRRPFGFASMDFTFSKVGFRADHYCLAVIALPSERTRQLITGQFVTGTGFQWQVKLANL